MSIKNKIQAIKDRRKLEDERESELFRKRYKASENFFEFLRSIEDVKVEHLMNSTFVRFDGLFEGFHIPPPNDARTIFFGNKNTEYLLEYDDNENPTCLVARRFGKPPEFHFKDRLDVENFIEKILDEKGNT